MFFAGKAIKEQTPKVLIEDDLSFSSYSSRNHSSDIIQKMFNEAVENNENLKSVTSNLEKVRAKSDKLKNYNDYVKNNQNYWRTLSRYSNQLSDSTLKDKLVVLINTLKKNDSIRTAPLNKLAMQISSTKQKLNDLEILMKIIVTQPMMDNYQRNELPDINNLKSIKTALDSSIIQIEPYTKIQK